MEKSLFSGFCSGTLKMYLISFGGILELLSPFSHAGLGRLPYSPRSQASKWHTVEVHLFPSLFILFLFYIGVWLIHRDVLDLGVQQSDSYICTYSFSYSFPI